MYTIGNLVIYMTNDYTKEYRVSIAVDQKTYNLLQNLALELMTTKSQLGNLYIMKGLQESPEILNTTKREYSIKILTEKSDEFINNLRKIDEFYDFRVNFWQICLVLGEKLHKKSSKSCNKHAIQDLIKLISVIRDTEPELYQDCVKIMKKTLNKAQLDIIL